MNPLSHASARFLKLKRCAWLLGLVFGLLTITGTALDFPDTQFHKVGDEYRLTVGEYPLHYFNFRYGTDLERWNTVGMGLSSPVPTFGYTPPPDTPRGFFIAEAIDYWSPGDADYDGMDDLWELLNNLNPLDPSDANLPSIIHPGMTNLECYRFRFGLTRIAEYYSVETTVFNHPFAISVETSVYNFPNFTGASIEAISAEASVYNFPSVTGASVEAISAEVSLFNSPAFTGPSLEAISDEVSLFNTALFTGPSIEAISDEVSLFNTALFTGPGVEAISPEVSVFNFFAVTPSLEAISVELSVLKTTP